MPLFLAVLSSICKFILFVVKPLADAHFGDGGTKQNPARFSVGIYK
jgi:hypothetical protein